MESFLTSLGLVIGKVHFFTSQNRLQTCVQYEYTLYIICPRLGSKEKTKSKEIREKTYFTAKRNLSIYCGTIGNFASLEIKTYINLTM